MTRDETNAILNMLAELVTGVPCDGDSGREICQEVVDSYNPNEILDELKAIKSQMSAEEIADFEEAQNCTITDYCAKIRANDAIRNNAVKKLLTF